MNGKEAHQATLGKQPCERLTKFGLRRILKIHYLVEFVNPTKTFSWTKVNQFWRETENCIVLEIIERDLNLKDRTT